MPDPLAPGVGVLSEQGGRQLDPAGAGGQVLLMLSSDDVEVPREVGLGDAREQGDAVLVALAAADDDLADGEVDVLDAEPAALEHAEPGPVEQVDHEARHAVEPLEQSADLIAGEDDRQPRHERPTDRFAREQTALIATSGQPGFRLEASQPRRVADDYLVSFERNLYSVPFTLIGQTVEVTRRSGRLHLTHRGQLVAEHEELRGKYLVRILPDHGPGAIARTARRGPSSPFADRLGRRALPEVEIRDLEIYDTLSATAVSA